MNIFQIPSGFTVHLVGAGGIGATAALALAKIGVGNLVINDDDLVSEENLATQLHRVSDTGRFKVDALRDVLEGFSDEIRIWNNPERIDASSILKGDLVISAVDSMVARHAVWDALLNAESRWDWYLDCRMAAEEYQHFLVRNEELQMVRYWSQLSQLDDDNVADLPCTAKATFYTAMMAAGHIGKVVRDIARGEAKSHRLVHNIPTHWLQTFSP